MEPSASPTASAAGRFSAWCLPGILLLALALRLCYFGWAQSYGLSYQEDGIEAYEVAANYDAGDERAQYIGQPNCNLHSKLPGPLWTLFCLAGIKLTGNLDGVVWLTIFANLAAIGLTWRLTRDVGGVAAANLAALFMAVSLWAVAYSSIVWNPSLIPLFGAVLLLVLFRCQRKPRSRTIFLIPFLILAGAQFHMSTLSLIVPLIVFGWAARLKPDWRWLAAGLVTGMLCYVPYILGEMRHGWANTHGMLFSGPGKFSPDALKVFSAPFTFLVNFWNPGWTYMPGEYLSLTHQAFGGVIGMTIVNVISVGFAISVVVGAVLAVRATRKNITGTLRAALAGPSGLLSATFLLLLYLAFNLVAGKPFHSRYCLVVLPLIFMLVGCGAARCLQSPGLKKVFAPLLLVTVIADIWFMAIICRFERDRIANSALLVPSCARMESVYQQLKTHAPGWIEMNDADYITAMPTTGDYHIYYRALLLGHYIRARQLELRATGTTLTQTNRVDLHAVSQVDSNDPAIVFRGNGIALTVSPGLVQR